MPKYYNKVELSDGNSTTTVMDISDTTAVASDVAAGKKFYTADGAPTLGTGSGGNYMELVSNPTSGDILVTDANGQAVDSGVAITDKMNRISNYPKAGNLISMDSNGQAMDSGLSDVNVPSIYVHTSSVSLTCPQIKGLDFTFGTDAVAIHSWSTNIDKTVSVATSTAVSAKQDALTAGNGIDITNNVISTTGSYTAGEGIDITNDVISIDENSSVLPQCVEAPDGTLTFSIPTGAHCTATFTQHTNGTIGIDLAEGVETIIAKASDIPTVDQTYSGTSANAQSGVALQPMFADLQTQIDGLGEPFRLQDFTQQINLTIPHCNQDIANTSIPNVDIDLDIIDPTGTLNQSFAIAGLAKYEVYDATSGGNRINCWPVCSFSMNGQRVLRIRMMCAGNTGKTARRIAGALLLKHR